MLINPINSRFVGKPEAIQKRAWRKSLVSLPRRGLLATHADDSHGWHLLRDGFAIWLLRVAESGLDRLRQLCSRKQIALYGASPFVVVGDVPPAADATLRTTGMVIDFPGFAYSMMLISPT